MRQSLQDVAQPRIGLLAVDLGGLDQAVDLRTGRSGLNWDQLVYLPKQNYDQVESKTLLGRWAYLYE